MLNDWLSHFSPLFSDIFKTILLKYVIRARLRGRVLQILDIAVFSAVKGQLSQLWIVSEIEKLTVMVKRVNWIFEWERWVESLLWMTFLNQQMAMLCYTNCQALIAIMTLQSSVSRQLPPRPSDKQWLHFSVFQNSKKLSDVFKAWAKESAYSEKVLWKTMGYRHF